MPVLIVIGVVALVGAVSSMRGKDMPVRTTIVGRQSISSTISTNGKIEPITGFEAHALAPATVKRVLVKEGDWVKAGQLLVELDDANARADAARALAQVRAAQADLNSIKNGGTREEVINTRSELARAQAELQAAQRNFEAMKKLEQSGAASPAEVQDAQSRLSIAQNQVDTIQQRTTGRFAPPDVQRAESNLAQAQAAYSAAQDVLAHSIVRSTLPGTVYFLPVKPGGFVNPGDIIAQVADLSRVMVRAFVDEPDIGRIAQGQAVKVTWDALPGRSWQGSVTQVPTTVLQRGARTVGELTLQVDNEDRKLLPNVNVNAVITVAHHDNALTVPREAVHQDDGTRYVFQVVGENKIKRKDVETSISNLTLIEIANGLRQGDQIALGSLNGQPLRDGAAVKPVP